MANSGIEGVRKVNNARILLKADEKNITKDEYVYMNLSYAPKIMVDASIISEIHSIFISLKSPIITISSQYYLQVFLNTYYLL